MEPLDFEVDDVPTVHTIQVGGLAHGSIELVHPLKVDLPDP